MYSIGVDCSPSQKCKLKRGDVVRIKQGKGMNLIINPGNYNILSRAFSKNKGANIRLSQDEIDENMSLSPEEQMNFREAMHDRGIDTGLASIEGTGLYAGKGIGKFLKKHHAGKVAKKIYKNPVVRNTVRTGLTALAAEAGVPPPVSALMISQGEKMAGVGMYAGRGMFAGGNVNQERSGDNLIQGKHALIETQRQALTPQPQFENYFMKMNLGI